MYPISVLAYQWKSPFLPRCLKVTEKVSFNNASEGPFWRVKLEKLIDTGHL